jgi:5-methylcytosine-specific restriction endonuclease McrA
MGKVKLREKVLMLKNIPKKKCRLCYSREDLTYDHKMPFILGGTSELKNIQVLCKTCNNLKSRLPDGHFRTLLKYGANLEARRAENKLKYKKI